MDLADDNSPQEQQEQQLSLNREENTLFNNNEDLKKLRESIIKEIKEILKQSNNEIKKSLTDLTSKVEKEFSDAKKDRKNHYEKLYNTMMNQLTFFEKYKQLCFTDYFQNNKLFCIIFMIIGFIKFIVIDIFMFFKKWSNNSMTKIPFIGWFFFIIYWIIIYSIYSSIISIIGFDVNDIIEYIIIEIIQKIIYFTKYSWNVLNKTDGIKLLNRITDQTTPYINIVKTKISESAKKYIDRRNKKCC